MAPGLKNPGVKISGLKDWRRAARLLAAMALVTLAPSAAALAQQTTPQRLVQAGPEDRRTYDIPAQALAGALNALGRQAGLQITLDAGIVAGVQSQPLAGSFTVNEALGRLLSGTGITWRFTDERTVALEKLRSGAVVIDPVTVEGRVQAPRQADLGTLPAPYAGGQVARGGRAGVLGNVDNMDLPFQATSYTAETIRNQQARTIADVLMNDPSVRPTYGFGNFSELFVIRGFQLSGDDIAVDGLYGLAPRQIVALEMYERVELFKGASAFLNGAAPGNTAIGGAVNLVPKRAGDEPLARFTASYDSDVRPGAHADLGRRFGPDNAFGARVNLAVRDGETSVDDEERSLFLGALALDYRSDRFRVTLDGTLQRQKVEQGRPVLFVAAGNQPPAPPSARTNYSPAFAYSELQDAYGAVRAEYDILPNLTAHVAFGARKTYEDGDYTSPTVNSAGVGTVGRLTVPREDNTETGQAGLRADVMTGPIGHRLNAGSSALHSVNHNGFQFGAAQATNIYAPPVLGRPPATLTSANFFGDPPKVAEVDLVSLYVSDTLMAFDERVQLTLGVRKQDLYVKGYNRVIQTTTYDESAVTPVVGLVVKPLPELSLYANRIEGLAQGPTAPAGSTNVGTIFPPFKSKQYEVGAKLDLGSFGAGLAFFQTEQPQGVTAPGTLVFSVDGEQRNRGAELTFFGEPWKGVRLLGGITLLDAVQRGTAGGVNDGKDAIGVPDYQFNVGAEWDLPFLPGVTLSGRVLHTGSQYLNAANTQKIPSWTRLDLGARYATEIDGRPVVFRASVENVTNEAYWASANGGYLTLAYPLTAKLSASVDF